MAATTKTLTPTNQVISIPAFTDKPDYRLPIDSTEKLADAVNALDSKIAYVSEVMGTAMGLTFTLYRSGGAYMIRVTGTLTEALSGSTSYEICDASVLDYTGFVSYVIAIEFNSSTFFGFYISNNKLMMQAKSARPSGSQISMILTWAGRPKTT